MVKWTADIPEMMRVPMQLRGQTDRASDIVAC